VAAAAALGAGDSESPGAHAPGDPLKIDDLPSTSTLNKTPNFKQLKKRREDQQKKKNEEKRRQQAERRAPDLPPQKP